MLSRKTRGAAFVALVAGAVVVLGFVWPDPSPRGPSPGAAPDFAPPPLAPAGTDPSNAARSTAAAIEPSHPFSRAPVRLEVHAPQDVSVGDVFQARIDIDSSASVRDLMFSIGYEKSRLALVGRSDGGFVRQSGVPHEFGVDEPSDGNIVVIYNARNGSSTSGAGTIVIFEFEAIGAETSAIVLHDVTANDGGGEGIPNIVIADERVTIH